MPKIFSISAFYSSESFFYCIIYDYARRNHVSIDNLRLDCQFIELNCEEEEKGSFDCILVNGLYMQGARWSPKEHIIKESLSRCIYDKLPIAKFKAIQIEDVLNNNNNNHEDYYKCPIYKTINSRKSDSDDSAINNVLSVYLRSKMAQSYWINRGVALLCEIDE